MKWIGISCPICGKAIEFPDEIYGTVAPCPICGVRVTMMAGPASGEISVEVPSAPATAQVSASPVRSLVAGSPREERMERFLIKCIRKFADDLKGVACMASAFASFGRLGCVRLHAKKIAKEGFFAIDLLCRLVIVPDREDLARKYSLTKGDWETLRGHARDLLTGMGDSAVRAILGDTVRPVASVMASNPGWVTVDPGAEPSPFPGRWASFSRKAAVEHDAGSELSYVLHGLGPWVIPYVLDFLGVLMNGGSDAAKYSGRDEEKRATQREIAMAAHTLVLFGEPAIQYVLACFGFSADLLSVFVKEAPDLVSRCLEGNAVSLMRGAASFGWLERFGASAVPCLLAMYRNSSKGAFRDDLLRTLRSVGASGGGVGLAYLENLDADAFRSLSPEVQASAVRRFNEKFEGFVLDDVGYGERLFSILHECGLLGELRLRTVAVVRLQQFLGLGGGLFAEGVGAQFLEMPVEQLPECDGNLLLSLPSGTQFREMAFKQRLHAVDVVTTRYRGMILRGETLRRLRSVLEDLSLSGYLTECAGPGAGGRAYSVDNPRFRRSHSS